MKLSSSGLNFLVIVASVLAFTAGSAFAEESKGFFNWNSNFIKKSDKPKGIPANPPKKKLKGIPTQPAAGTSANAELTEEEMKSIQAMSLKAGILNEDAPQAVTTPRGPHLQPVRVPRAPQVPKFFAIPKNPNVQAVRIPSPPTAFSSNNAASGAVPRPSDPNKQ